MSERYVPLTEWSRRKFDPPPSIRTLRQWARSGRIHPSPIRLGRQYRVKEDAEYVPDNKSAEFIEHVFTDDPVVMEIINGGKAKK